MGNIILKFGLSSKRFSSKFNDYEYLPGLIKGMKTSNVFLKMGCCDMSLRAIEVKFEYFFSDLEKNYYLFSLEILK